MSSVYIPKKRESNLELYRIVVMILIVSHHYVVNSGLLELIKLDMGSPVSLFYWLFGAWGKTGINCFVLITGYFMCKSNITVEKFLKLIFQILFYNLVIGSIFCLTKYNGYSLKFFFSDLMPISSVKTGFTSCFILFWLTIPFLNKLIQNINCKEHGCLVVLGLFIYTLMLYVPFCKGVNMNYVSWFIVIYFVASFVRLYPDKIYKSDNEFVWGMITLSMLFLSVLSICTIVFLDNYYGKNVNPLKMLSDSNALFALLLAFSSFMFFKNLKIKYNKLINIVAACTFGVLLIHANSDSMRNWLWYNVMDCAGHYGIKCFWVYSIVCVLSVFSICIVIEYIRIRTIEKWTFLLLRSKFKFLK